MFIFIHNLTFILTVKFLTSLSIFLILLNLKKSVTRFLRRYTTAGISESLLCLRSSTRSFSRRAKESGKDVSEFSDSPSVVRFTKHPISVGRAFSLLLKTIRWNYNKRNLIRKTSNIFIDKTNWQLVKGKIIANYFNKNSLMNYKKKLKDLFLVLTFKK